MLFRICLFGFMAQFTKKAIIEAFYKLLSEKPLDRITVKEIIEECGVTRNTFYYYYSDVYELFEKELTEATDMIIDDINRSEKLDEISLKLVGEAVRNKKLIKNVYLSREKGGADRHISETVDRIADAFVNGASLHMSDLSADDIRIMRRIYKCTLLGVIDEWLGGRMEDFSDKDIEKMAALLKKIPQLVTDDRNKCSE